MKRKILSFLLIAVFLAVDVFGLGIFKVTAQTTDPAAEAKKDKIENKIDDLKDKAEDVQKDLNVSQTLLTQKQIEANKTQNLLQQTQGEIGRKEAEVENLNKNIELDRKILESYIRELYMEDQSLPFLRVIVNDQDARDIYGNFDNLLSSKQKLIEKIKEIKNSKEEVVKTKEVLAEKKDEHAELLAKQKNQQVALKEDIWESMATLEELQKKLAELQSDLLAVTGKSYNAKDIKEAVEFASGKTGVPKGVLYGFLTQESGRGKNVGQCSYADVKKVSIAGYKKYGKRYQKSIDTLYYREKLFNNIIDDLGYKSKKVSCTIPFSSAGPNQGGAMGAAQFMSDTWGGSDGRHGYVPQISSMTGHSKPDPWDITDAVVAMAIKIRSAGGTSDSNSAIKKAVINYYGAYSENYYKTVVYWAKNYKTLLS